MLVDLGTKTALLAYLSPSDARTTVTWKSSNSKVVSVTDGGYDGQRYYAGWITAHKEGKAKITAATANGKKATFTVNVQDPYKPQSIAIKQGDRIVMNVGERLALETKITPALAGKSARTWKSSRSKVAAVDGAGTVTAYRKGTAKITVATANKKKAAITVEVVDPYEALAITPQPSEKVVLRAGQTLQLGAMLRPATARATLSWATSRKSVATVSNKGLLTAVKKGSATITVRTDNGLKARIKVEVIDAK